MDLQQQTHIEFTDATGNVEPQTLAQLAQLATALLAHLACRGTLRVRIVSDAEMAASHLEFAGVEGTTDVLAFDMSNPEGDRHDLDADFIICLDEAHRQVTLRGHPLPHELLLYITHATLHCLGHHDDTEDNYRAMHEAEDAALTAIGIGPIFGDRGGFQPH